MDRISWVDASERWAQMQTLSDEQQRLVGPQFQQISKHAAVLNNRPQIPMMTQLMRLDGTHGTDLLTQLPGFQRTQQRGGYSAQEGAKLKGALSLLEGVVGSEHVVEALGLLIRKAEMREAVMVQMASLVAA
ncbi:MAG: hypothetical protein AB7F31_06085 [Parachlamydiales bacterium]